MEIDKYLVLEELGSGNYGVVYRVLDRALNVEKAIKVIKDSPTENLIEQLEEARILYMCRNKNIVTVNEANIFRIENEPHVVIDMELIRGTSLEKHMEDNYLSSLDAVRFVTEILYGLDYAHQKVSVN